MQYFINGFQNLVRLNIHLQIVEQNVLILNYRSAALYLIVVILQELDILPWQMDLLKYKIKILGPIWECSYLITLIIGLSTYPRTFFAYAHKSQPFLHLHIPQIEIKFNTQPRIPLKFHINFLQTISWMYRTVFHWIVSSFSLSINWYKSFSQWDYAETNFIWFLAIETAMLQIHSKVYQYELIKKGLLIQCQFHPIWINYYHWTHFFNIEFLKRFNFRMSCCQLIMVSSKFLLTLQKSRMKF